EWASQDLRLEANTHLILDLFDQHRVKSTFFVLGWIADRCPGLVREIQKRGHEVASHGYGHQSCFNLSKSALWEDLRLSKTVIEGIIGQPVLGYRAPSFSITENVLEGLASLGYRYDSSLNQFTLNKRNRKMNGPRKQLANDDLMTINGVIELPVSNLQFGAVTIPWGGGGYFRLWPVALFEWGVKRILQEKGRYVFYFHPWEIDSNQPVVKDIRWLRRFRHYLNLSQTRNRLADFFTRFEGHTFVSCSSYLNGRSD
ncbi:MAG: DUF3473 domain-containing protein, partial [Deltaproteobacteria bacterium]|nr:DUF3473 domain-containing protein [Deltaproteobacteria bacterium]